MLPDRGMVHAKVNIVLVIVLYPGNVDNNIPTGLTTFNKKSTLIQRNAVETTLIHSSLRTKGTKWTNTKMRTIILTPA